MTGSLVNTLISRSRQPEPEVGTPATVCMWSDRSPVTVVEVARFKTGQRAGQVKGVRVRPVEAKCVSGSAHDGSAQYEYIEHPEWPATAWYMVDKRGRYVRKGGGDSLSLGKHDRYYDPHF